MTKRLRIKLEQLLDEHQLSLRELGRLTDIGHSTLSHLKNQKLTKFQKEHLEKIIDHFKISDMNELFEVVEVEEDSNFYPALRKKEK